ncbi:unnamed protein product, partial [Thelazia callipaeda]|uniref:Tubulin--tyrosine ligase-like protein 9 n=1 Tax=Thelazia callipaeda TaxID=103827 RepID=A0A0N5CPS1_THECL
NNSQTVARNFTIDTSRAKSNKQVVSICASKLGMHEYSEGRNDGSCDIYWFNIIYHDMRTIIKDPNAKINKFPGMSDLTKKISLTRAISSMRRLFPDEYQYYPSSWFIPAQLDTFVQYCKSRKTFHVDNWYIVKPNDGARGSGIYLIQQPEQIREPNMCQLIQEYIVNPYLLKDNLKFDLRVYAVIKSINPLSIYVAREGMARFCTEKYAAPTTLNIDNYYAHLTNYSLNKANNAYIHSVSMLLGSKRLLSTVLYQMAIRGVKTKQLWHKIKIIIVKTVIAMLPEIILNYEHYFYDRMGPQCFQIMGFDILITENLEPVLLEVNSSPSLTIEHCLSNQCDGNMETFEPLKVRSIVDEIIKIPLVRDTILLVLDLLDDIFPYRYGQSNGHLLFLDKAVYLFMQFENLTIHFYRLFRKCGLLNDITMEKMELKYMEIYKYFTTEQYVPYVSGLSFHGFLYLLYHIAQLKFPFYNHLLEQMQQLLAYCDASLRNYGVRSAHLRHAQIYRKKSRNAEIYLLPSRIHEKRSNRKETSPKASESLKVQPRHARSLPRTLKSTVSRTSPTDYRVSYHDHNKKNDFVLPRIQQPFRL